MPNWSAHATSFIGRDWELAEIGPLLVNPNCRLLTLSGPGGVGKTRLALAAAEQYAHAFTDGVFLASLQAVPTADELLSTVADALQITFRGQTEPEAQILTRLRARKLLLILDNLEHLLTESGLEITIRLLGNLIQAAPDVMVLVTSREVLRMHEEWIFPVRGLPYVTDDDEPESEAVALFVDRARRAHIDFPIEQEAIGVRRVCQLVEGNPLALELAAAWTRSLSCLAIADQIEQDLSVLVSQQRNVSARHASIQAVFDQSWSRLTRQEQVVLQRLSIFLGGCTQDAAQRVVGATLPILAALVDRSLLRQTRGGRLQLHEYLRQCATERLNCEPSDLAQTEDRHADYYLSLLHRLTPDLRGSRQAEAEEALSVDVQNIFAAWRWAVAQGKAAALGKAVDGLILFCEQSGRFHEGLALFQLGADRFVPSATISDLVEERIAAEMSLDRQQEIALAQIQTGVGMCLMRLGRPAEGRAVLNGCIDSLRQAGQDARRPLAFALFWHGHTHIFQSSYHESGRTFKESLALYTELDDAWGSGASSFLLGSIASLRGEFAEADRLLQLSEQMLRPLGERRFISFCISARGIIDRLRGDYDMAERRLREGLEMRRQLNDLWSIGYSTRELGYVAIDRGDYPAAKAYLEECLTAFQETGAYGNTIFALDGVGTLARLRGDMKAAESLHWQALTISEEIDELRGEALCRYNLGCLASDQEEYAVAEAFLQASLDRYYEIGHQPGVGFAASQLGAIVGRTADRRAEAGLHFTRALDVGTKIGATPILLDVLLGWATLLLLERPSDEPRGRGAELLALVNVHPASTHDMAQRARKCLTDFGMSPLRDEHPDLDNLVAIVRSELAMLNADSSTKDAFSHPDLVDPLTRRETEVLSLIEQGLSNRAIAEHLVLTVGTVKWYTSQIYSKLGVQNRSQAVHVARQLDLLQ